ncbi:MAG TPA: universal stress protein [Candidatus Binatia bacterium]
MAFKRILAAVDFSRESVKAFFVAVEIARLHSAALLVFHVIEAAPAAPHLLPAGGLGEAVLDIVEKANAAMARLIEDARPALKGLAFESEVITGRAFDEIVERAGEWKADLVVLGSKGATSLEDALVGGTAQEVVERAPCSVLVKRSK